MGLLDWAESKAEAAKEYVAEKAEEAKEKAEAAKEYVAEKAEEAKEKAEAAEEYVAEKAEEAKEKAEAAKEYVAEKAEEAKEKAEAVKEYVGKKAKETIKSSQVLDVVINHPDKIKTGEVALGAVQTVGGITESVAGVGAIGGSGGLATAGGAYLAVDGVSNVSGGSSRIVNGLKGLDSSSGGGDTENFVKNGFKAIGPKDGMFSGENLYNATQLGIGAKAITTGVLELPNKMEKITDLYRDGKLVGGTVGISLPKLVVNGGSIAVDIKNEVEAATGMNIQKPAFDVKSCLDRYINTSSDIENKMGLSQTNNQQQNRGMSR